MDGLLLAWERRTTFAHAIANRNHHIKCLLTKGVEVFGGGTADIDAHLSKHLHRIRMHLRGFRSGTRDLDRFSRQRAQQTFRHLRTRAILGAEKEHTQRAQKGGRGSCLRQSRGETAKDRVKGKRRSSVAFAQHIEIETVINIPPIGATAAFSDQMMRGKHAQMIRDQVLWLLEPLHHLLATVIAVRQLVAESSSAIHATAVSENPARREKKEGLPLISSNII